MLPIEQNPFAGQAFEESDDADPDPDQKDGALPGAIPTGAPQAQPIGEAPEEGDDLPFKTLEANFRRFARLLPPWWYKLPAKAQKPRKSQILLKIL